MKHTAPLPFVTPYCWGYIGRREDGFTCTWFGGVRGTRWMAGKKATGSDTSPRGLWGKSGIPGGKYLVTRRDGTVPEWQWFVLGSRDPAAPNALRCYANEAERLGMDPQYVADVRALAYEYINDSVKLGRGDPDAPPHRKDDPETVAKMIAAGGSA